MCRFSATQPTILTGCCVCTLCSQSWVTQYYEVGRKVHIAVENISRHEAYTKIQAAAEELVPPTQFDFDIVEPLVGTYTPCPYTACPRVPSSGSSHATDTVQTTADHRLVLTPGVKIYCERMEPASPGDKVGAGCALYSGSVKLRGNIERGLTVGHLFEDVGLECSVHSASSGVSVGRCQCKISFIDLADSLRKTTADLALLDVYCPAENTIVIDNATYLLRLSRGFSQSVDCPSVAILSYNGDLRRGEVVSTLFTISALGLYNTLCIVDPDNSWSRVNNPGDSGALVISVPDPSAACNEVVVYGMVIGYFETDDGSESKTIATRLWDILHYVDKLSQFGVCSPLNMDVESGYVSVDQS